MKISNLVALIVLVASTQTFAKSVKVTVSDSNGNKVVERICQLGKMSFNADESLCDEDRCCREVALYWSGRIDCDNSLSLNFATKVETQETRCVWNGTEKELSAREMVNISGGTVYAFHSAGSISVSHFDIQSLMGDKEGKVCNQGTFANYIPVELCVSTSLDL